MQAFGEQAPGAQAPGAQATETSLYHVDVFTGMTLMQLRRLCSERNMATKGSKAELQRRLRANARSTDRLCAPAQGDVDHMNDEEVKSFLRAYCVGVVASSSAELRGRLKARVQWRDRYDPDDALGTTTRGIEGIRDAQEAPDAQDAAGGSEQGCEGCEGSQGYEYNTDVNVTSFRLVRLSEAREALAQTDAADGGATWQSSHVCRFLVQNWPVDIQNAVAEQVWPGMVLVVDRKTDGGVFVGEVWMPAGLLGGARHELCIKRFGFDSFDYSAATDKKLLVVVTAVEARTLYTQQGERIKTVFGNARIDLLFVVNHNVNKFLFIELFGGSYGKKIKQRPSSVFASMFSDAVELTYRDVRPVPGLETLLTPDVLSASIRQIDTVPIARAEAPPAAGPGGDAQGGGETELAPEAGGLQWFGECGGEQLLADYPELSLRFQDSDLDSDLAALLAEPAGNGCAAAW